jgi:formylglycine-generating enzyme required for sulfatase activity
MDKVVHKQPSLKEKKRLKLLQEELEGQELTALLERLKQQCDLSVNQMAVAAGMDESAFHKILKGENREFKADHVNALMDELERLGKFSNPVERTIWLRAFRISSLSHYDIYKAIEPRLRQIEDPVERIKALEVYLRKQYSALAETYDETGGTFPVFIPFIDALARELHNRWGWIRVPPGYRLSRVEKDHYYLASTDLFPKEIHNLGPNLEIEDTGFGTFTVRRRSLPDAAKPTPARSGSRFKRMGGLDFVRVPAGTFLMGSHKDNKLAYDGEKPQHTVEIPRDYWMGQFPVTAEQYELFVLATGHHHTRVENWVLKFNHPVVNVSWNDAQAYCKWLNEMHGAELPKGYIFRLPTEAEWEKAARGEYGNEWPWGNEFDPSKCNSEGGKKGTTPVGAYSPAGDSPYGAADMVGNVWEWTQSLYKPYPYVATDGREDLKISQARVLRGGSWDSYRSYARCSVRLRSGPDLFNGSVGFRLVCSPSFPTLNSDSLDSESLSL